MIRVEGTDESLLSDGTYRLSIRAAIGQHHLHKSFFAIIKMNDGQISEEMGVVGGIEPTTEDGGGGGIGESLGDELAHQGFVTFGEGEVTRLAMQVVANGDLAEDDVGQRIDEVGRAGEVVVARLDGGFEVAVGYLRGGAAKEQDGTMLVERLVGRFLPEKEFGGDEPEATEQIHLVELRIIAHVGLIEGGESPSPSSLSPSPCPYPLYPPNSGGGIPTREGDCFAIQYDGVGGDAHAVQGAKIATQTT